MIRDHYQSHRLSFWLNLIPRLMLDQYSRRRDYDGHDDNAELMADAFDKDENFGSRYIRDHLLHNFDDVSSYEGRVRQITLQTITGQSRAKYGGVATGTGWLRTGSSAGSSLLQMNADQSMVPGTRLNESMSGLFSSHSKTANDKLNTVFGDSGSSGVLGGNRTGSGSDQNDPASYSTALSVTIAVGGALLVLNMLIFAGVYYQLDRHREASRNSSPINCSQMTYHQTNGCVGGMKNYETMNSKLHGSASTTLTAINDHSEVRKLK